CDYDQSFTTGPPLRVASKVFDTDMMKNVRMSPHNRLKDSLIIDPALKSLAFLAFIDSAFNLGAEFRANFARRGQRLRQLVIGGNPVSIESRIVVPATVENERVSSFLGFKNARK